MLLGGEQGVAYRESVNQQLEPKKPFVLPEANQTMHRAFAYLIKTRCVDPKVVSVFAGKHMIYEDVKYHNVVFVGFDSDGIPRHAHKRGTCQKGQPFKGNVEGCDPRPAEIWPEFIARLPAKLPITVVRNKADITGETLGMSEVNGHALIRLSARTGERRINA